MALVPQLAPAAEDRASGAQVIDGSLTFDKSKEQYLTRTPGSDGDKENFTWSVWLKRSRLADGSADVNHNPVFCAGTSNSASTDWRFQKASGGRDDEFWWVNWDGGTTYFSLEPLARYRDVSGFYHLVCNYDGTTAKVYINGSQVTDWDVNTQNGGTSKINSTTHHSIGSFGQGALAWFGGNMSQFYLLDGLTVGPSYFGYTDQLTNVWRPKKFLAEGTTVNNGTVWSSGWATPSGGWHSSGGAVNSFDGSTTTYTSANSTATAFKWTNPGSLSGVLRIYADATNSGNGAAIKVNDTQVTTMIATQWYSLGTFNSVDSIEIVPESGNRGWVYAIEVDGVIMKDSTTQNLAYGTNGCYLPFDGNTPIGQDKSGRGNNWTPVNFGADGTTTMNGSSASATVSIDTPGAGALPILNTVGGGKAATTGFRPDPYASSLVLAIPGATDLNDYSATIKGSGTNKTVTNNGATTPTTKSHYYGSAIYSDGSDSEFQVGSSTEADFAFAGEFTWEMWWYPISSGATTHARAWYFGAPDDAGGGAMHWYTDGNVNMYGGGHAGATSPMGTTDMCTGTVTMDAWNHIAVTRDGANKVRIFLNGVKAGEITNTNSISSGQRTLYIGGPDYETAQYWQDIRLYNGACKYREDFNPGSPWPDVTKDTPSGTAYSSELTKPTAGSVAFDGADDYLRIASSSDFDQNAGIDFTAECFFYMTEASGPSHIFGFQIDANNRTSLYFTSNTTTLNWWTNLSGSNGNRVSVSNVSLNAWHHVAITRSGSTTTMWLDGVSQGTSTTTDYPNGSQLLDIGTYNGSGYNPDDFPGFISNVRYVKGTAVYTANFTPPKSPLTNITNTKLLCCQGSSAYSFSPAKTGTASFNLPLSSAPFTDSSSNTYTVTNTGSVTTASAGTNNFNITNAASFDGSSQRLNMNSNVTLTGDWTIDAWIKLDSSASGYNAIYNSGYTSSNNTYIYMSVDDDEKPYLEGGSAGGRTTATNAINKNQWYHFRAIQDAGGMHLYVDGEKVVTHGKNTTDMSSLGTDTIGSLVSNGNNANNMHGLIGPVRYVSSTLGPPPVGGLPTTAGALSNTPDIALGVAGNAKAVTFNPFDTGTEYTLGRPVGYCTLDPLSNGGLALSDGNLKVAEGSGPNMRVNSTISVSSGKWYYELTNNSIPYPSSGSDTNSSTGLTEAGNPAVSSYPGSDTTSYAYQYASDNNGTGLYYNGSKTSWPTTSSTAGTVKGGVVMVAFDLDNSKIWFGRYGNWLEGGNPVSGANPAFTLTSGKEYTPTFRPRGTGGTNATVNFGQKPFKFPPPEGFSPLCTADLPSPGLTRPDQYVGTSLYTGNGGTQVVNQLDFQPDLVWIKQRSNGTKHRIYDSVRGVNSALISDETNAADQYAVYGQLASFNRNGFTVASGSSNAEGTNETSQTIVAWSWKAGGNKNTFNIDDVGYSTAAAAGLTAGSVTPTGASVGTKQGFSIIKWTAPNPQNNSATIPHGLTQKPNFWVVKCLDASRDWINYTNVIDGTLDFAHFNNTEVFNNSSATAPTATTFGVYGNDINTAGEEQIAYLWHDVPGVQKFGSYEGNQSADGPYVNLGFSPAIIIFKNVDSPANWMIYDNRRDPYNESYRCLYPNLANAENTNAGDNEIDLLSTGFKLRNADTQSNHSQTYIYAAWAHQPEHNLYGGQSNAR